MRELQRLSDAVGDHRRAEARAEADEQHPAAVVTPERLHDRVVHDLRRTAERAPEVEVDPALAEIGGLQDGPVVADRHRDPDARDVPGPALGRREHFLDHLARRHRRPGLDLARLDLALEEELDVRSADVDGEDTLLGWHGPIMTV